MTRWLLAVLLAGCALDAVDETDGDFDVSASNLEAASTYNADPFKPTNGAVPYECIDPAASSQTSVAAQFFDGTTAGLSGLYYKPDQPASSGAKWDNYGDQAGTGPTHYSYLLWTWPEKPSGAENAGGGQIRAVIAEGEQIRTCNVEPAYLPMFRANRSTPVGRVKML